MNSTSSEAQITQSGQAIRINNNTASTLSTLFSTSIGPFGSSKALVSSGRILHIAKDGNTLCKEIQFTHPTSIVIIKAATSMYTTLGDGVSSFVVLCCSMFNAAFEKFNDGTPVQRICGSLQSCLCDVLKHLKTLERPFEDDTLNRMAYDLVRTKVDAVTSSKISKVLVQAVQNATRSQFFDVNMIEVIKMPEGDVSDTAYVHGLVLDHSGRHYGMPTCLEEVCVLVANFSLEYEKPEVNAEFCYSSAKQRDELAENEREFILRKARAVAALAKRIKDERGKSLFMANEKGIDPYSLKVLADAGVLALRRTKRRNLERLLRMCGGSLITRVEQLDEKNLGYCQRITTRKVGEESYTFVEGVPLEGSCTILIKGSSLHETSRMDVAIRGALKSLFVSAKNKVYVNGGYFLYRSAVLHIKEKMSTVPLKDVIGYEIMRTVFINMIKILLRNEGKDIQEELERVIRGEGCGNVVENPQVFSSAISNAVAVCTTLLLVDEIIKAGKSIREDKPPDN